MLTPSANVTASPAKSIWRSLSHLQRCRVVAAARKQLADDAEWLAELCESDQRTDPVETVTAEITPLCAALKFIGKNGPSILRSQRFGVRGRPIWLWGVTSEVSRVAWVDVLILAAWNYPLLLPGVQIAQALAAGNHVWFKPAPGCEKIAAVLVSAFLRAGVPQTALSLLPSSPAAAQQRIDDGVDLVVLTGGSTSGRAVMTRCAQTLTPSIMELSGCDAVLIGPGADLDHAAKAIAFGLTFNAGATCIGPRRLVVSPDQLAALVDRLREHLGEAPPQVVHPAARKAVVAAITDAQRRGAVDILGPQQTTDVLGSRGELRPRIYSGVGADWKIADGDLFAPVASLLEAADDEAMVQIVNRCRYRLAASVFGPPLWARSLADRLDVGHVSINDMIFPTADPRIPFGGRGHSGFGVTRGAAGLLAMSQPKVTAIHRGSVFLHLRKRGPSDLAAALKLLRASHGGK